MQCGEFIKDFIGPVKKISSDDDPGVADDLICISGNITGIRIADKTGFFCAAGFCGKQGNYHGDNAAHGYMVVENSVIQIVWVQPFYAF